MSRFANAPAAQLPRAALGVACACVAVAGCNDAVTLAIDSDRPVPQAIDAICVGVADRAADGGQFGRRYTLAGKLATLPQTLRVDPGRADAAWAWVRGDRAGVPVARAGRDLDFVGDVVLGLDRCERGPAGAPAVVGDPAGPAGARLVASHGADGAVVVALGDAAAIIDADGDTLVARDAPAPPPGGVVAAIAADVDGDCDDDLVIAAAGGPPVVWRRDARDLRELGAVGDAAVAALAAGDVDRDGDIDLITGGGGTLALWRNDGSGAFALDAAALSGDGRVASVAALALGDLDGDGNPDLVVGQAGDPLAAWLGDAGGTGSFVPADAVVPAAPVAVEAMQLVDLDGDFDPDLAVAVANAPARLYVDRDGRLEDQTFVRLASPVPAAHAIAIGGWDPGCEPDAVFATDAGTESRRGVPGGAFEVDGDGPAATDAVLVDLDDDGDLDAVIATEEGARWLAR